MGANTNLDSEEPLSYPGITRSFRVIDKVVSSLVSFDSDT
jgi:hypothetical protein